MKIRAEIESNSRFWGKMIGVSYFINDQNFGYLDTSKSARQNGKYVLTLTDGQVLEFRPDGLFNVDCNIINLSTHNKMEYLTTKWYNLFNIGKSRILRTSEFEYEVYENDDSLEIKLNGKNVGNVKSVYKSFLIMK